MSIISRAAPPIVIPMPFPRVRRPEEFRSLVVRLSGIRGGLHDRLGIPRPGLGMTIDGSAEDMTVMRHAHALIHQAHIRHSEPWEESRGGEAFIREWRRAWR